MRLHQIFVITLLLFPLTRGVAQDESPVLITRNTDNLKHNAGEIQKGNTHLVQAKEQLLNQANKILSADKTYSVTFKKKTAPSGDIHDFYSMAKYWWPDPKQPDGKPYIQKDGKPYPGRKEAPDSDMLSGLGSDVYRLGLAYYFTGDKQYAERVKKLVTLFFLEDKTKMNPNFDYAQTILGKGHSDGSIVSANPLMEVIEGLQLTRSANIWSTEEYAKIKQWYVDFLDWMRTSKTGQKQRRAVNNIGTYYTVQAATYALFTDQKDLARKIIEEDAPKQISNQIDAQGRLEEELKRAKPWSYVMYDLDAFKLLVEVAEKVGVDLWSHQTDTGGSIQKAFAWLEPFAKGDKKWPYKQNVEQKDIQNFLKKSGFYASDEYIQEGKISYIKTLEN